MSPLPSSGMRRFSLIAAGQLPAGAARVAVAFQAEVDRHGVGSFLLDDLGRFQHVHLVEPQAHLHRQRQRRAAAHGGHHRRQPRQVLQQPGAGAGAHHLGHRAAHVQVDAGVARLGRDDRRGLGQGLGVGAEKLDELRRARRKTGDHLQGAAVAAAQPLGGDHFRDHGAAAADLVHELAQDAVGQPGHGGQDRGVFEG